MSSSVGNLTPSLGPPLCAYYALGIFDMVVLQLRDAGVLRNLRVHWAFGWLADGEGDALGCWIEAQMLPHAPSRMLADLQGRGVGRIWHVIGTADGDIRARVCAAFSGSASQSSVDPHCAQAIVAEQIREGLARSIRRHGCFESEAAVLDFFTRALQRAERRVDRAGMGEMLALRQESGGRMLRPAL